MLSDSLTRMKKELISFHSIEQVRKEKTKRKAEINDASWTAIESEAAANEIKHFDVDFAYKKAKKREKRKILGGREHEWWIM